MEHLGIGDMRAGVHLLQALGEAIDDPEQFGRRGVEPLPQLVASEPTTPSVLRSRERPLRSDRAPAGTIGAGDRAIFDRYFNTHPALPRLGARPPHPPDQ